MKTTKRKFLDSLRGIGAFVAPYKRAFLFAILMIVVSTAAMVIALPLKEILPQCYMPM